MNIEDARHALAHFSPITAEQELAKETLKVFIAEVEDVVKNNSIKQTPALFRPFDKGG